jgi:hypothetical protein
VRIVGVPAPETNPSRSAVRLYDAGLHNRSRNRARNWVHSRIWRSRDYFLSTPPTRKTAIVPFLRLSLSDGTSYGSPHVPMMRPLVPAPPNLKRLSQCKRERPKRRILQPISGPNVGSWSLGHEVFGRPLAAAKRRRVQVPARRFHRRRVVTAVRAVTPDAAGSPVFVIEAASSVVTAFSQAGILSIVAIALILFVALRRWIDVALTLVLSSVTIMAMSSSGCRRRLQDLLHHCVAVGGNKLPAIKPHAGHLLQRLHDRDCIREPVFLTSSRHIEHGQAHGSVAPDDPVGRSHFPAGSPGNPAGAAPSRFAGFRVCHFVAPHRSSRWTGSTV